ncbi:hypothetical protein [Bacillus thuringiensis]|uniref:hypothetical protein n=1 Tax=Bacillus thuringiensis TaxID=1428 RepID=UPI000BF25C5F|nr:hypothetical protein [Bacillus thuringiensis]PEV64065.1 hypothetical protein CN434_24985 [Bacillus thuringiensis]
MISMPRNNKPKLSKADQERFLRRKREVDERNKQRKEQQLAEIKKSEDLIQITVGRPELYMFS